MVLYENDDFIIAYKPPNCSFHSENEAGFVVQMATILSTKLFSVHRLDKMTSGLIIFAKSSEVAAKFSIMFEKKEIEKYYLAISLRKPKKKQGWIKADMTSARRGSYKLLHTTLNPAITQFISAPLRTHERLFLIKPHTGKTHQIRVALKSIGSAIAGDIRYANIDEAKMEDRGYLHAYGLNFQYNSVQYTFCIPPAEGERFNSKEFQACITLWDKPWELFKQKEKF